ncbi:hypothetical protein ABZ819_04930 [Streptomyces venezuelae]|uniref:hypothetical protein n=1 Tax=Streptomyces venezuelae TaxID=54571 RepID=UPI003417C925
MTAAVSAAVIQELATARRGHRMSAQRLAEQMTAAGYPIKRSVIANVESGRREEISVDYLSAASLALKADAAEILRRATGPCLNCKGAPPHGFICATCAAIGGAA